MSSRYGTIFRRNKPGDPVREVCNTGNLNTAYSVLEDTQGVWCRIERDSNNGVGWRIVIDGGTDIDPGYPPPWAGGSISLPWVVTATPNTGGGFRIKMITGRFLAVSSTASGDLPISVRTPTGSLPTAATASGYVTLAINARFNETTKKFSGVGGVVSYGAEVGTSGTFANIPVAKVTISGNAATVEQYLVGTITIPLFPPLKAVTDAVRGVDYNATTGALTATKGTGVAFDDSDSTQDETLFTAVDEEI